MPGWLGAERMRGILDAGSFTCHKTKKALQCAGHMIVRGEKNYFVALAKSLNIALDLSGASLVFQNEDELIEHHS